MRAVDTIAQRIRESLFFIPVLVVAVFLVAARAAVFADQEIAAVADTPMLITVTAAGGRTIAAAVAGATMTVAAVVFSITALSSQIAANQYSPRVVAGFFDDRFQQFVIGLVVGTFAFALGVVAGFGGATGTSEMAARSLSATLTVGLGLASAVAIIGYIDHSVRRMRIDAVVRRIADATVAAFRREHRDDEPVPVEQTRFDRSKQAAVVARSPQTGWVQDIDADGMADALPAAWIARVDVRVGEAVSALDRLVTAWPPGDTEEEIDEDRLLRWIRLGRTRNLEEDPAYGLRQLVDIALRALSPGVNDPTTAIDVLQHLKLPLREILELDEPQRVVAGEGNQRVFLPQAASRADFVHAALSEIRLAARGQAAVLQVFLEICADLLADLTDADRAGRGGALRSEASLAVAIAKDSGFPEPDLKRILAAAPPDLE